MKIDLPHVEHTIQVLVSTPEGDCVKVLDSSHRSFEMELPDNVCEEEVEVLAVALDERGLAIGEMQYLKEAVAPKDEDEDALREIDGETTQSLPDKQVDEEEVKDEKTCDPKIALDD